MLRPLRGGLFSVNEVCLMPMAGDYTAVQKHDIRLSAPTAASPSTALAIHAFICTNNLRHIPRQPGRWGMYVFYATPKVLPLTYHCSPACQPTDWYSQQASLLGRQNLSANRLVDALVSGQQMPMTQFPGPAITSSFGISSQHGFL